jgi:uncharacterized metal-binding protein
VDQHVNVIPPLFELPVVYACSGCSDAGELADRIARQLTRDGAAEMSCIAGVGGCVRPLLNKAQGASRVLAIDGCPLNCVANTLRVAGVRDYEHLELHKLGFRKGQAPATEENVRAGVEAALEKIGEACVLA